MSYPLVIWMQARRQTSLVVVLLLIPAQADQKVLSLDHKQGEVDSNLIHLPSSR